MTRIMQEHKLLFDLCFKTIVPFLEDDLYYTTINYESISAVTKSLYSTNKLPEKENCFLSIIRSMNYRCVVHIALQKRKKTIETYIDPYIIVV